MQDKNYWLIRWKEQRLKEQIWRLYPYSGLSWQQIFDYFKSGMFENDIVIDIIGCTGD